MDPQSVQKARDSLSRCNERPEFLERFYELFMASSPDIRKKFENTDFEVQKQVLRDSLFLMLSAAGTKEGYAHVQLEKLAKRHSHNDLGIKPEWYVLWLDTLLATVAEFDPDYSDEIAAAWRDSMKEGIELLAAGY
jgi:hemoglobin-like flavoprotein